MLSSIQKLVSKSESRDSTCPFQPHQTFHFSFSQALLFMGPRTQLCWLVANSLYFAVLWYFENRGKERSIKPGPRSGPPLV